MIPDTVVKFWDEAGPSSWFSKDEAFDADLRTHFHGAHMTASRGGFGDWEQSAEGALGLILLTDQIPRNIFRDSAHAFATDARAREVAARALDRGFDRAYDPALRCFFYLPFEHSERIEDQTLSVALFEALGEPQYLKYAELHRDIIARFGRFPHRNQVMGRVSTAEEMAFLGAGGFAG